jgi:hypothetical protein
MIKMDALEGPGIEKAVGTCPRLAELNRRPIHYESALEGWRVVSVRAIVGAYGGRDQGMVVAALALAASSALVQAMVSDGWQGVRHKVARLFGRGQPDPQIEKRLDATRQQLATAAAGDLELVQADQARQWETRFADLLADHPDAEPDLAALVEEIRANVTVAAADHAVAAGRDVTITASGGGVAAGVIDGNVSLGPTLPGPAGS